MIPFFFKKKDKDPSNLKRLLLKSTKRKSFSTEPEHRKPPEGQLRTPSRKADKKRRGGSLGLITTLWRNDIHWKIYIFALVCMKANIKMPENAHSINSRASWEVCKIMRAHSRISSMLIQSLFYKRSHGGWSRAVGKALCFLEEWKQSRPPPFDVLLFYAVVFILVWHNYVFCKGKKTFNFNHMQSATRGQETWKKNCCAICQVRLNGLIQPNVNIQLHG